MSNPAKERFRQDLDRILCGFTYVSFRELEPWERDPPPTTLTRPLFVAIIRSLCDAMGLDFMRADKLVYWGADGYGFDIDTFFRTNDWTVQVTWTEVMSTTAKAGGDSLLVLTHDNGESQRRFTREFDPTCTNPFDVARREIARLETVHWLFLAAERTVRFINPPAGNARYLHRPRPH